MKTERRLLKKDKCKFKVPKTVQEAIPVNTIWNDGIFLVDKNTYSKTFKFNDINYAVESRDDKECMFLDYSELLNSLDSGATTKITILNKRINGLIIKVRGTRLGIDKEISNFIKVRKEGENERIKPCFYR